MKNTRALLQSLEAYHPHDAQEKESVDKAIALLQQTSDCFLRSDFPNHFVAGVWLVSPDGDKALLMHHAFLGRWLQCGGHADGHVNLLNVALREAQEESGIENILPLSPEVFDVDVHDIPANAKKNEPAHVHYSVNYLMRALDEQFFGNAESLAVKWFTVDELDRLDVSPSVARMREKWKNWLVVQEQRKQARA